MASHCRLFQNFDGWSPRWTRMFPCMTSGPCNRSSHTRPPGAVSPRWYSACVRHRGRACRRGHVRSSRLLNRGAHPRICVANGAWRGTPPGLADGAPRSWSTGRQRVPPLGTWSKWVVEWLAEGRCTKRFVQHGGCSTMDTLDSADQPLHAIRSRALSFRGSPQGAWSQWTLNRRCGFVQTGPA